MVESDDKVIDMGPSSHFRWNTLELRGAATQAGNDVDIV